MERELTHSCGHQEKHMVFGFFAADADREARRLSRRKCTSCFRAGKAAKADTQGAADRATLDGIELPPLSGSEKQVAWAAMIRLERLAALHRSDPAATANLVNRVEAKWWIDNRTADLKTITLQVGAAT